MKFAIDPRHIFLIDGLKLENGILKEVGSNKRDVLPADLPSHSLGYPYD